MTMAGSAHISRNALAVLAIFAAALVLARPVCELWHAHVGAEAHATWVAGGEAPYDGGAPTSLCCPYVVDTGGAMAMQAAWTGGTMDWQPPAFAPVVLAAAAAQALVVRQAHWRPSLPRAPRSFYLRSARIRR